MRVLDDQGRLLKPPPPHECEDCQLDPLMPLGFTAWADWHVDQALTRYDGPVGKDELADALVAHGYCRLVDIRLAAITDGRFVA